MRVDGRPPLGLDALRIYLDDIQPFPLLTPEEEVRLARFIEEGEAARRELESLRASGRRRRLERAAALLRQRLARERAGAQWGRDRRGGAGKPRAS